MTPQCWAPASNALLFRMSRNFNAADRTHSQRIVLVRWTDTSAEFQLGPWHDSQKVPLDPDQFEYVPSYQMELGHDTSCKLSAHLLAAHLSRCTGGLDCPLSQQQQGMGPRYASQLSLQLAAQPEEQSRNMLQCPQLLEWHALHSNDFWRACSALQRYYKTGDQSVGCIGAPPNTPWGASVSYAWSRDGAFRCACTAHYLYVQDGTGLLVHPKPATSSTGQTPSPAGDVPFMCWSSDGWRLLLCMGLHSYLVSWK